MCIHIHAVLRSRSGLCLVTHGTRITRILFSISGFYFIFFLFPFDPTTSPVSFQIWNKFLWMILTVILRQSAVLNHSILFKLLSKQTYVRSIYKLPLPDTLPRFAYLFCLLSASMSFPFSQHRSKRNQKT